MLSLKVRFLKEITSQLRINKAFSSLKSNKNPKYDDQRTSRRKYLGVLKHVLHLSINQIVFSENMKIVCVTPKFKSSDEYFLTSYRPILVLPYFSNILSVSCTTKFMTF